jgi:hypothetical protein
MLVRKVKDFFHCTLASTIGPRYITPATSDTGIYRSMLDWLQPNLDLEAAERI